MRTSHQRFEYREIARSAIQQAPYNPRTLSAYARKKLKAQLTRRGLVETLVWNEVTGNLVSGHARLELLDDLEGGADYQVGVSVVQLSPEDERTQNVFFNNIYAQGSYDEERFVDLVRKDGATLDGMGFTLADLQLEFGLVPAIDDHFAAMHETQAPLVDAIREVEKNRKFGELDAQIRAQNADVGYGESDYTIAILFRTPEERDAFCAQFEVPADYLWSADVLESLMAAPYRWRTHADESADVHVSGDPAPVDHPSPV